MHRHEIAALKKQKLLTTEKHGHLYDKRFQAFIAVPT